MSKATETELTALHGALAKVLSAQIEHQEEETTFNADGMEVGTGNKRYTASPATMSAAIKFLKDNQITADIETDENLSNLKDVLAKKQKHSRTGAEAALLLAEKINR